MPLAGPQIPFGAVYFRKSNPPRDDWERDYGVAAEDGLNTFRHWFMWNVIERRPGVYDWDDYDRQLDLAAENGLKTIIAEMSMTTPDWALRKYPEARQIFANGQPLQSVMSQSSATPGFGRHNGSGSGVLTFNHQDVKDAAGAFLTELATRYKGHPGLWGYDVWNECNYSEFIDYSEPTKAAYRRWLKDKYGTLEALAPIWHRYSYADWDDIEPPRELYPYAEGLDWIRFKRENNYDHMQFRIETIKAVDPDVLIAAHGVAGFVTDMASRGSDDWLAASKVDIYGFTWIQARRGAQPWRNFFASDLIRSASRGKPFWHAERQGGPLWMQPQVLNRDKEDGRVAKPEDIRVWSLSSFAGGAGGMMNLRYRPLLNGPLFGAFGSYGMDGSRTNRSEMASSLAKWTNDEDQASLFASRPVPGDIGILVVPDVQEFDHLLTAEGGFDTYAPAMFGTYRGFFDNNILVDWVHIDDIDDRELLYFPYPIMLTREQADRLSGWVKSGGTLICEACPAYFGDHGAVGTHQPNHGLNQMFGADETEVEFMPDIAHRYGLVFDGLQVSCGGFLQAYAATTGTPLGQFHDGRTAIVEHRFGKGRTLLIGTHPGIAYHKDPTSELAGYYRRVLDWAGRSQQVSTSNPAVQVRLSQSGDRYLWMVNPSPIQQRGRIILGDGTVPEAGHVHWAAPESSLSAGTFQVAAKDALIVRLKG